MKFRAYIAASQNGATVVDNKHAFSHILKEIETHPLLLDPIIMDIDTYKDIHPYLNKLCQIIVYDPANTAKTTFPNNSIYIADIGVETLVRAIGRDVDWVYVFGTADFFKLFTDNWLISEVIIAKMILSGEESQFIDYDKFLEGYEKITTANELLITTEVWCLEDQPIPVTGHLTDEELTDIASVMNEIIDSAFARIVEQINADNLQSPPSR